MVVCYVPALWWTGDLFRSVYPTSHPNASWDQLQPPAALIMENEWMNFCIVLVYCSKVSGEPLWSCPVVYPNSSVFGSLALSQITCGLMKWVVLLSSEQFITQGRLQERSTVKLTIIIYYIFWLWLWDKILSGFYLTCIFTIIPITLSHHQADTVVMLVKRTKRKYPFFLIWFLSKEEKLDWTHFLWAFNFLWNVCRWRYF